MQVQGKESPIFSVSFFGHYKPPLRSLSQQTHANHALLEKLKIVLKHFKVTLFLIIHYLYLINDCIFTLIKSTKEPGRLQSMGLLRVGHD